VFGQISSLQHRAADERCLERCHLLGSLPWALANGDDQQSGYGNWQGIWSRMLLRQRRFPEPAAINIDGENEATA